MNKAVKIMIVVVLIVAVGTVIALKQQKKNSVQQPVVTESNQPGVSRESQPNNPATVNVQVNVPSDNNSAQINAAIPRLVDLGAGKCIPCKMMAPILEELKKEYEGAFKVDFIDVWENPDAGQPYGIKMIPTQIFYDPAGKELFRHEGFFSKEDILAKWKELGYDFTKIK